MADDNRNEQPPIPARLAAEMQDELLAAGTELERLERLLGDAVDQLLERFGHAHALATQHGDEALREELRVAMTALQFQDLASQLISHSRRRLGSVADCLGNVAVGGEEEGCEVEWVRRACPVAQRAVDAGTVEIF